MRPITMGCTARRAWSTLLRDSRLPDLSAASALDGKSIGRAAGRCSACDGRSARLGVGTASAGAAGGGGGGAASSTGPGALKVVAGRTGRTTSAT